MAWRTFFQRIMESQSPSGSFRLTARTSEKSQSPNILFFSRGRGRGHATPDIAIVDDLLLSDHRLKVQFVSYGTGASVLRDSAHELIDLGLPDDNSLIETLIRSIRVINELRPTVIISHEEFCVPPAAQLFGVPCLFLTDWFPPNKNVRMDCLGYADSVIFMDEAGYCDEPSQLREKIEYVGPVIRELKVTKADRAASRAALHLPCDCPVFLILPGGAAASSELHSPIFDLVTKGIDLLENNAIAVWVLSPSEEQRIKDRAAGRADIRFMQPCVDIECAMVASDVVITKATRKTSLELYKLGIQSISISHGLNPIDDFRVSRIKTNRALRARGLSPGSLRVHLAEALYASSVDTPGLNGVIDGRARAVAAINQFIKSRTA